MPPIGKELYPDARVVPAESEPGWGHVWVTTADGIEQPVADLHLDCGSVNCFTQTMPDGSLRHVCRECAAAAARPVEES